MATKDDRPGLLSKVAMFVRNPTRDWSELDQTAEGDAAGYDKQALKAMIERKRQNDFVRKREFDQLRKLRNRDPVALASMARQSFFQTSLATDLDGRAVTLKKIDEIEAQMSRQWWKAKAGEGSVQGALPAEAAPELLKDDTRPYQGAAGMSLPFASTEPMSRFPGEVGDEFAPTQMSNETTPGQDRTTQPQVPMESNMGFSTSALFAIGVDTLATDPELEEAAIRFANSDDAGAEEGLLAALRGNLLLPQSAHSWAAALLDFYRATGRQQAFEDAAHEFALYLDGAQPAWAPLGKGDIASTVPMPRDAHEDCLWNAPAVLTAQGMEALRSAMESQPMPWQLGWGALQEIALDARPLLEALFESLCEEAAVLRFDGHEALVHALRQWTPSGDRQVDKVWWTLRLNALRAMGLQDEFELAALEYCITYEAAPLPWEPAACQLELLGAVGASEADFGVHTGPMGASAAVVHADIALRGEILGDTTRALAVLDQTPLHGTRILVDCSDLVRVDFAAAGNLLNWVSMRQAEGRQVQLHHVHRLVAAFFNVIGINEYAKVVPRAM